MAGYRRSKTYVMTFEDEDLAGLEIKARGASLGMMMHAAALAGVLDGMTGTPTAQQRDSLNELVRLFAGCPARCQREHDPDVLEPGKHFHSRIREWNFEDDDGDPLPPGHDGFADQDMELQIAVIFAWIDTVSGSGGGPLGENSNDGTPSAEESIPMETLSDGRHF